MPATIPTISKQELWAKLANRQNVQIVNVLDPSQYQLGIIPGSKLIPLAELDRRVGELDKSKEVITYCARYECDASRRAAEKLAGLGYNVRAYEGGIMEWTESGLPTQ